MNKFLHPTPNLKRAGGWDLVTVVVTPLVHRNQSTVSRNLNWENLKNHFQYERHNSWVITRKYITTRGSKMWVSFGGKAINLMLFIWQCLITSKLRWEQRLTPIIALGTPCILIIFSINDTNQSNFVRLYRVFDHYQPNSIRFSLLLSLRRQRQFFNFLFLNFNWLYFSVTSRIYSGTSPSSSELMPFITFMFLPLRSNIVFSSSIG